MMKLTRFQKLLSVLFLFAALLIVLNGWLAFHAEEVLASSERWVTHTLEVITRLEHTLAETSEAESSVRGFVLTGQQRYLAPFTAAEADIPQQFNMLTAMTRDNPERTAELVQAGALTAQRMVILHQAVAFRRTHSGAQTATLLADRGEDLMTQLRAIVQRSEAGERSLLGERLRESARARTEAKLAVALASSLDILFVIFSLGSLNYERRLRQRSAETSAQLEKLQSVTEVAFTQLPVAELTTELLARLKTAARSDVLILCRWQDGEIELAAVEGVSLEPGERRAVLEDDALAESARTGQPVRLSGDGLRRLPLEALHQELRFALVVPMSVSGRVIAMLVAGRKHGSNFSLAEEELLRLAADRIALAIDRAAAYDAERAARQAAESSAAEILELNAVLEDRVQQRTAELETTNRELEAFSYSVSHDLRAPLRSVDGFSVALEEDYGALLEGDGKHYLARIRVGVQRMGSLIDALLQLSRITRAELTPETIELSAIAESVAEEVLRGYPDRRIHFEIEPGLEAQGDPRLLRVVFENMFGNAAKFTGKVDDARIGFGWSAEKQAYYIRDNGAGFDQQYVGKLFVAFQRLHGDKDFAGSGIGLATVARVVHRHHGDLWAEGAVGHGATFWFTLG